MIPQIQRGHGTPAPVAFTPALKFGGAAVGMTYSTQVGYYVKVGQLIIFQLSIVLTAKGSSTGNASVSLPFTASGSYGDASVTFGSLANISFTRPGANIVAGVAAISLRDSTSGGALANMTHANFADTSSFDLAGFYMV